MERNDELALLIREQEADDTHRIRQEAHVAASLDYTFRSTEGKDGWSIGDLVSGETLRPRRASNCSVHGNQDMRLWKKGWSCAACKRESNAKYRRKKGQSVGKGNPRKGQIFGCQRHGLAEWVIAPSKGYCRIEQRESRKRWREKMKEATNAEQRRGQEPLHGLQPRDTAA